jgi:uncharacterized protein (TIGR02145 family)
MKKVVFLLLIICCQNIFSQGLVAVVNRNKTEVKTSSKSTSATDIDGNVYNTVRIGKQVWMTENLKTTRYSDGTPIPLVNTISAWETLTPSSSAYCWYNDTISNKDKYGALYTWAAAMNGAVSSNSVPSGVQGVCPVGWHLPSDEEWTILTDYLTFNGYSFNSNGINIAKAMSYTAGWTVNQISGTVGNDQAGNNSSGFSALPGGSRLYNGTFNQAGYTANWWRSTETSATLASFRYITYSNNRVYRSSSNKQNGFSIRCLQNY